MTYRNLLHRLAKDLDDKELDQEVIVSTSENVYARVIAINDVKQGDFCIEKGQIVLDVGDL